MRLNFAVQIWPNVTTVDVTVPSGKRSLITYFTNPLPLSQTLPLRKKKLQFSKNFLRCVFCSSFFLLNHKWSRKNKIGIINF